MDLELGEFVDFAAPSRIARAVPRRGAERKRLVAHSHDSPRRRDLEEFVRDEFFLYFNARVRHFMPLLLALHDRADRVHAVVGCRRAADEPLFLETYTREPIERSIARRTGGRSLATTIVEIGSLACCGPRAALEMVEALIPFLLEAGFGWVVFTGAGHGEGRFSTHAPSADRAVPRRPGAPRRGSRGLGHLLRSQPGSDGRPAARRRGGAGRDDERHRERAAARDRVAPRARDRFAPVHEHRRHSGRVSHRDRASRLIVSGDDGFGGYRGSRSGARFCLPPGSRSSRTRSRCSSKWDDGTLAPLGPHAPDRD